MDLVTAKRLIIEATEVKKNARVPLSGFHVGATLLATDGEVICGCNMEFGNMYESVCAERCALAKACSMGYRDFLAIAIVSDSEWPLPPCGLCRHVLMDFNPDMMVILSDAEMKHTHITTVHKLMPDFDLTENYQVRTLEHFFDEER